MKKSQKQFLQEIPTPTSKDVFIIGQKKSSCFQEEVFLTLILRYFRQYSFIVKTLSHLSLHKSSFFCQNCVN